MQRPKWGGKMLPMGRVLIGGAALPPARYIGPGICIFGLTLTLIITSLLRISVPETIAPQLGQLVTVIAVWHVPFVTAVTLVTVVTVVTVRCAVISVWGSLWLQRTNFWREWTRRF